MPDSSSTPASTEAGSFTERLIALGRRAEAGELAPEVDAPPPVAAPDATHTMEDGSLEITDRDIIFDCPRCYGELIVDRDGENMETSCIHCGATLLVPKYAGPPAKVGKVQAQFAGGAAAAGAPTSGLTDYRPTTGEYPTAGPSTGDYATGATQQMLRNLAETVATSSAPVAGEEAAAPEAPANSDKSSILTPDGALTEEVQQEMRELNFDSLDMDAVAKQIETVKRHLKENNSQVTEVTGYVNQTSIKLHRFKLQLERLKKRNTEIHKEMRALKARSIQLGGSVD